jgi:hypothetical protein
MRPHFQANHSQIRPRTSERAGEATHVAANVDGIARDRTGIAMFITVTVRIGISEGIP